MDEERTGFNDLGGAEGHLQSRAGFWLSSYGHVKALIEVMYNLDQAVDFSDETTDVLDSLKELMPADQSLPEKLLIPEEVLVRIFSAEENIYLREAQRGILSVLKEEMGNEIGSIKTFAKVVKDFTDRGDEAKAAQKAVRLDESLGLAEGQAGVMRVIGGFLYNRAFEARVRMERRGAVDDVSDKDFQMVRDYRSLRAYMMDLARMQEGSGRNFQGGLSGV